MRGLVAAVLVLATACGGPASPPESNVAPSGTSGPSLTAGDTFRCRLYPYSLALPEGWVVLSSGRDEFFETSDQLSSLTVGTAIPEPVRRWRIAPTRTGPSLQGARATKMRSDR